VRVAVISDIHANWPALEAVLADLSDQPPVDEVLCLGDVVGYGAEPVRCLDHVRAEGWLALCGNHDRACVDPDVLGWFNDDAAQSIHWTIEQLGPGRIAWLEALPEESDHDAALLVHASPRSPLYEYVLDLHSAAANLEELGDRLCFHGHTHVPGVFRHIGRGVEHEYDIGTMRIAGPALVNPGSVGQPRDRDPDASYGVWEVEASTFEFRRVPYDRAAAQRSILEAGLPARFAYRLDSGY
jgi:diadenosine tetraphosphatase ApaH/serine/threonine PP2A family protein phosphatase